MDEIHRLTRVTARGLHLPRQAFNADTDRGPKGKGVEAGLRTEKVGIAYN